MSLNSINRKHSRKLFKNSVKDDVELVEVSSISAPSANPFTDRYLRFRNKDASGLFAGKLTRSTAKNDRRNNICVELQIDGCSAQRHERGERPAAQRGPARSDKRFHSSLQDRRSLVLWLVGWCCCHLD